MKQKWHCSWNNYYKPECKDINADWLSLHRDVVPTQAGNKALCLCYVAVIIAHVIDTLIVRVGITEHRGSYAKVGKSVCKWHI